MSYEERIQSSSASDKEDCPPFLEAEDYTASSSYNSLKSSSRNPKPKVKTKEGKEKKGRPKTLFRFANWTNREKSSPIVKTEKVEKTKNVIAEIEEIHSIETEVSKSSIAASSSHNESLADMPKIVKAEVYTKNELYNMKRREKRRLQRVMFEEPTFSTKQTDEERRFKNRERMKNLRNKRRLIAWFEANNYPTSEIDNYSHEEIEEKLSEIDTDGIPTLSPQKKQLNEICDSAQLPTSSSDDPPLLLPAPLAHQYNNEHSFIVSDGLLLGMDDNYRRSTNCFEIRQDMSLLWDDFPSTTAPPLNLIDYFRNKSDKSGFIEEEGRVLRNL